jgi:hypothetical protein
VIQIEPSQWYDEEHLRVNFGWSADHLRKARDREGLRCRTIGRKRLYKGAWLLAWLEGGAEGKSA